MDHARIVLIGIRNATGVIDKIVMGAKEATGRLETDARKNGGESKKYYNKKLKS